MMKFYFEIVTVHLSVKCCWAAFITSCLLCGITLLKNMKYLVYVLPEDMTDMGICKV